MRLFTGDRLYKKLQIEEVLAMHAVVRQYSGSGAKELFDVLEENKTEVERLSVPQRGLCLTLSSALMKEASR